MTANRFIKEDCCTESHMGRSSSYDSGETSLRERKASISPMFKILLVVLMVWCILLTAISVWAIVRTYDDSSSVQMPAPTIALGEVDPTVCTGKEVDGCLGRVASLHPNKGDPVVAGGVNVKKMMAATQSNPKKRRSRMGSFPYNESCHVNCVGSSPTYVQVVCSQGEVNGNAVSVSEVVPLDFSTFTAFVRASKDVYVAAGFANMQAFRVVPPTKKSSFPHIEKGSLFTFPSSALPSLSTLSEFSIGMVNTMDRVTTPGLVKVDPSSMSISVFQPKNATGVGLTKAMFYTAAALDENYFVSVGPNPDRTKEGDVLLDVIRIDNITESSVDKTTRMGIGSFKKVHTYSVPGSSSNGFVAVRNLHDMALRPAGEKTSTNHIAIAWYDKQSHGIKDAVAKWDVTAGDGGEEPKLLFAGLGTVQSGYAGAQAATGSFNLMKIIPDTHHHREQGSSGEQSTISSARYIICFPNDLLNGTITGALRQFYPQLGLHNGIATGHRLELTDQKTSAGDNTQGFCDGVFVQESVFMMSHYFSSLADLKNDFRDGHAYGTVKNKPVGVFVRKGEGLVVQTTGVVHKSNLRLRDDSLALIPGREYFSDINGDIVMKENASGFSQVGGAYNAQTNGQLRNESELSFMSKIGVAVNEQHLLLSP